MAGIAASFDSTQVTEGSREIAGRATRPFVTGRSPAVGERTTSGCRTTAAPAQHEAVTSPVAATPCIQGRAIDESQIPSSPHRRPAGLEERPLVSAVPVGRGRSSCGEKTLRSLTIARASRFRTAAEPRRSRM